MELNQPNLRKKNALMVKLETFRIAKRIMLSFLLETRESLG